MKSPPRWPNYQYCNLEDVDDDADDTGDERRYNEGPGDEEKGGNFAEL